MLEAFVHLLETLLHQAEALFHQLALMADGLLHPHEALAQLDVAFGHEGAKLLLHDPFHQFADVIVVFCHRHDAFVCRS
ncbi:hypothetical protein [Methylomarinovum caldicuralii]|uniref:hypothetical protein n=1 Tax=Methylomarinovum caldicuralii TaxID=438856 RepID=UPI0029559E34|nr:hypothetical protein [Methylomarinovum caldicuralii]